MKKSKRERAAELILEGGATKASLCETLDLKLRALDNLFCYIRLSGRFPFEKEDGTLGMFFDREAYDNHVRETRRKKLMARKLKTKRPKDAVKAVKAAEAELKFQRIFPRDPKAGNIYVERARLDLEICKFELEELERQLAKEVEEELDK